MKITTIFTFICVLLAGFLIAFRPSMKAQRLLYVATARKVIHVYDINRGHKFVRSIPVQDLRKPRGITADTATNTLYVSFKDKVVALDPVSGKEKWRRQLKATPADRLDVTPDGTKLFVPSGLRSLDPYWYVLNARTGETLKEIHVAPGSHNTLVSKDGKRIYLASLKYEYLTVLSTDTLEVIGKIGPFNGYIRPFTVNAAEDKVYANIEGVLGFQVGDLATGKVERPVAETYSPKRDPYHKTPSHGLGLTPDGTELWVTDSGGDRLLIYDVTQTTPVLKQAIEVGEDPGWITFDIDGRYAYPSTGEVIEVASKRTIAKIEPSEKLVELRISGSKLVEAGSQFGIGRRQNPKKGLESYFARAGQDR